VWSLNCVDDFPRRQLKTYYVEGHYIFLKMSVIRTRPGRGGTPGIYLRMFTSVHRDHGKTCLESFEHVPECRYIPTRVTMIDRKPDVRRNGRGADIIVYRLYRFTILGVLAEFFFLFVPRKSLSAYE